MRFISRRVHQAKCSSLCGTAVESGSDSTHSRPDTRSGRGGAELRISPKKRSKATSFHGSYKLSRQGSASPMSPMLRVPVCLRDVLPPEHCRADVLNDFFFLDDALTMGAGSCGTVIRGTARVRVARRAPGESGVVRSGHFAIKVIDWSSKAVAAVLREVRVRQAVAKIPGAARGIASCHGVFADATSLYLQLEEGVCDLHRYVARRCLAEREAKGIVRELVCTLRGLHRSGWAHGDVKPANVILCRLSQGFGKQASSVLVPKFVDLERCVPLTRGSRTCVGTTVPFMSPEIASAYGECRAVTAEEACLGDAWALGCLAYALVTGCNLWLPQELPIIVHNRPDDRTMRAFCRRLARGDHLPRLLEQADWPVPVSRGCRDFLLWMLHPCRQRRMDLKAAARHPWLHAAVAPRSALTSSLPSSFKQYRRVRVGM